MCLSLFLSLSLSFFLCGRNFRFQGLEELDALKLDPDGNYELSHSTINSLKATIASLQNSIDENTRKSSELENQLTKLRSVASPLEREIGNHRGQLATQVHATSTISHALLSYPPLHTCSGMCSTKCAC